MHAPPPSAKPVSELRPKELEYDATPSAVHDWKIKFTAYHDASNMKTLPLNTQRAFLVNTVAGDISKRITHMATETIPIFPMQGQVSCFDYIDTFFKEKVPLIHRRKAFFTYVQQEKSNDNFLKVMHLHSKGHLLGGGGMIARPPPCLLYTSPSPRD